MLEKKSAGRMERLSWLFERGPRRGGRRGGEKEEARAASKKQGPDK